MRGEPARTRTATAGPAVVTFPAEVDLSNGEALLGEALRALRAGARGLILDLGGCVFSDSAGPNAIFRAELAATALGVPVVVVVPARGIVHKICEISGVTRRLTVAGDVGSARTVLTSRITRRGTI